MGASPSGWRSRVGAGALAGPVLAGPALAGPVVSGVDASWSGRAGAKARSGALERGRREGRDLVHAARAGVNHVVGLKICP